MTIQPYQERPAAAPALINPTTDSWTAVLHDVVALAQNINQTEFVPKDLRGSAPKVAAAILHGRELGLPPMTSLAGVHVIQGRPGVSAELMRALIQQAGHEIKFVKSSGAQCVMRGRRAGDEDWTEVSYSLQEAKDAGDYAKNANYKSRPADMLVARCTTRLARMIFADVIHGMRSIEELQDMVEGDPAPIVAEQVEVSTVSRAPRAVEGAPSRQGAQAEGGAVAGVVGTSPAPSSPPERKRPPLRGRVSKPQDESVPPETEGAPEPRETAQPREGVTEAKVTPIDERHQRTVQAAVMHFDRLGVSDRAERLMWTTLIAGREIASTNDLPLAELRDVVTRLERVKDRAALEALGAVLEAEREGQSDE